MILVYILGTIGILLAFAAFYYTGYGRGHEAGYWKAAEVLTAPPKQPIGKTAHDAQIKAKVDKFVAEMESTFEKVQKIQSTLREIGKLNDQELELLAAVDRPSASASHSLYKNKIIGEIKDIREKRIDLVKLLLSFGYDPVTTYVDENNQKVSAKLSDILVRLEGQTGSKNNATVTELKHPDKKKKPNFRLITNDEGDPSNDD